MNWRTPTTYLQRLGDAMALLCAGNRPSDEMLGAWLNECDDDLRLQEFACKHGPSWAQGIAVIDAAQVLADQPTEILCIDGPQIDHERHNGCYDEDGAPIKCWKCGCEKIFEKVTDTLDVGVGRGMTMEFECICGQCGERVGYWAHGSYDPCFMMANA